MGNHWTVNDGHSYSSVIIISYKKGAFFSIFNDPPKFYTLRLIIEILLTLKSFFTINNSIMILTEL